MTTLLGKRYNHTVNESKHCLRWQESSVYHWQGQDEKHQDMQFVIDNPPPTISGSLHMGHIFSYCHTDFIARFQRMYGKHVFYSMGFDNNGLPTERLVEKLHNIRAKDLPRKDFIDLCRQTVCKAQEEFIALFQAIGLSIDWQQNYSTIEDRVCKLSQLSFLDLYDKGHIYRALQPVTWDTLDQTALAQAEIIDREISSYNNTILFTSENKEELFITTTRPELLPACVAVFYHPQDKRYRHLQGQNALTPLFNVKVPILTDDAVKMDKGTGLVMCCTFGDELDVHWWQKHSLSLKIIIDKKGRIDLGAEATLSSLHEKLHNSTIDYSREIILNVLRARDLLIKQEAITHFVKCAERSGALLEIIPTYQWFIKILDKKDVLLQQIHKCTWYPLTMRKRLEQWITSLQWDWCISRQRYFGIPFPVWYKKSNGSIVLPDIQELPLNPLIDVPKGYDRDELIPESDVMDTWATSSLSPQINARGINCNSTTYHKLFPAHLRTQAHDIIRTWAFYTFVKAYLHSQETPWKNILISGWCLTQDRKKMSKSKGEVLLPQKLIQQYSADAIRYWVSTASLGADIAFTTTVVEAGKRLVTKLWNAGKFVSSFVMNDYDQSCINEVVDGWAMAKLNYVIKCVTKEFQVFNYSQARKTIEEFFWHDFCDNYLEIVKHRIYNKNLPGHSSGVYTTSHIFKHILLLFAPFMPFITEELYSMLYNSSDSIHKRGNWPISTDNCLYEEMFIRGEVLLTVLSLIRKCKTEAQKSLKYPIRKIYLFSPKYTQDFLNTFINDLKYVSNAHEIIYTDKCKVFTQQTEDIKLNVVL